MLTPKRLFSAALAPAVLLLGCVSTAPDPGAEIASEADRAFRQFDAAWSPRQKPLVESRDAQRELQRELFGSAPGAAARPEDFCSDEMRSRDELLLFAQINRMYDELMSGMLAELGTHESWSRRFAQARSDGQPDAQKRPLYRELAWSRARLDMLRTLLATYKIDAEYQVLRMQNACVARLIVRTNPPGNKGLINLQHRLERETERALPSFSSEYHEAFSRIGSTPGRP